MERFFDGQVRKLISLIRDRSPEADAQLAFMTEWGGGPLGAAALVAEAWLQDRAGYTDQASEQLDLMPWDPVEPLPAIEKTTQPPKRAASPDWVKAALAQKTQR